MLGYSAYYVIFLKLHRNICVKKGFEPILSKSGFELLKSRKKKENNISLALVGAGFV
jgi:hypothetical protein